MPIRRNNPKNKTPKKTPPRPKSNGGTSTNGIFRNGQAKKPKGIGWGNK